MGQTYQGKSHDGQSLGDRCKAYEAETEYQIAAGNFIIIRLDGHGFSKYTKGFIRPFDPTFSNAMTDTALALCKEFGCITGYVQSDEITLVLHPSGGKLRGVTVNNQIYSGRVTKLASLTAGFASATFNKAMGEYSANLAWFDSRVYGVSSKEEVANSIIWRSRDAVKNSKGMYSHTYCSHKSLLNKNSQEQIEICKYTTGNDWELQDPAQKYGVLIKKVEVMKYTEYLGKEIPRKVFKITSLPLTTFSEELVELLTCKVTV